jgi:seryl-tRNA synthetase
MLDIQFIRDNQELVEKSAAAKVTPVDIKKLLELDQKRRQAMTEIEQLRAQRNEIAQKSTGGTTSTEHIAAGKQLKEALAQKEAALEPLNTEFQALLGDVPNVIPDDTPPGGEEANKPVKHWGEAAKKDVLDHFAWGEQRDMIDFERATKVAGAKFYYLKGDLVSLELAVFQLGLAMATKYGFVPMTVPHLVNDRVASGTGFLPRGEERQIYKVEDENLNLIATAEMPLTGYHADEIIDVSKPLLYVGLSPAYRLEAGTYGKHSKGLYRVHQFNKLELYIFCKPEESEQLHQDMVEFEEELCKALEIPYQVVRIAAGDLGAPAYKKFDIEYWSPVEGVYRELTSCSNVTDYQARRLNIRYRTEEGKTAFVHTLNGTAAAFSRVAIALIENHQQKDGKLYIPKALQPYMGGKTEI